MGAIIGLIIFGIPSAIIAGVKGFAPFRWLLAFGLIGLIVVSCMSSARAAGITEEEARARASNADSVGAWMCGINVALGVVMVLIVLANS